MSFWSWLSRNPVSPIPEQPGPEQRPGFTDADREFVKASLDRFEANGLPIRPELNRDLVVARALVDIFRWRADDAPAGPSPQPLFLALASETDSLTWYIEDLEEQFPPLSSMDDEAAETMLEEHSNSIFVNASSINLVNEDNSLEYMVGHFGALGGLGVEEIDLHVMKNGLTKVFFRVDGLSECQFEITPALAEMNRIAKIKGLGQYIRVPEGSSESDTFILADETTLPKIIDLLELTPPPGRSLLIATSAARLHKLPRLKIPCLRRGERGELAAVGLDVEQRRAVEAVEPAHQYHIALDALQFHDRGPDRIGPHGRTQRKRAARRLVVLRTLQHKVAA